MRCGGLYSKGFLGFVLFLFASGDFFAVCGFVFGSLHVFLAPGSSDEVLGFRFFVKTSGVLVGHFCRASCAEVKTSDGIPGFGTFLVDVWFCGLMVLAA